MTSLAAAFAVPPPPRPPRLPAATPPPPPPLTRGAMQDPLGAEEGARGGALRELALAAAASGAHPTVLVSAAAALAALAEGAGGGAFGSLGAPESAALVALVSAEGGAAAAREHAAQAVAALGEETRLVPALLGAGAVSALGAALGAGAAPPATQAACARALAALAGFEGTWRVSAAHRAREFPGAVRCVAALAAEGQGEARVAALGALERLLAGRSGASGRPSV